jgi:CheY-like chemotaxis protein
MAISESIVRMMDGSIQVDSKLNEGTRFTVTIFLKLQDAEQINCEEFVDLPILVADGDEVSRESAAGMLGSLGMKAEGVPSGREAVARVTERRRQGKDFFAVILDWKMPDMDGTAAIRAIRREIGGNIPIIISAYDWTDIEQSARAAGANSFISKPLFKSRLVQLFRGLVSREEEKTEEDPFSDFSGMDLSGHRVLLVEDNELNAEIATEILSMTGIAVDHANDGAVAVDRIRDRGDICYDLILMDIQMPRMNGYDATRAIRNLGCDYCRTVPIIAMTANAFAEDVQAALSAGMNAHIAKPLDLKTLADVLNQWVVEPDGVVA